MDNLIRKRNGDEDEEIMLFLLPALYLLTSNGGRDFFLSAKVNRLGGS